ncbi:MAG TPA: hypothetical protein VMI75_29200 [Polyangiaceae bacterium]|nr:hypothetical protein [Polyangiaceae bacterium]
MTSFARASDLLGALAVVAATASAATARAQAPDKPLAETLFREGRALFEKGDYEAACAKFAASERVEAKLGTLLNLAACHEAAGRTASAWAEFTEAATAAARQHQSDRESFARDRASALEQRLSRVHLSIASHDEGLRAALDGAPLEVEALGIAFPVDPGSHTLVVSAPGRISWSAQVAVPPGPSTLEVAVPALDPAPVSADAPAAASSPSPPATDATTADPTRMTLGWIAIGVGVAGLAAGSYFGVEAFAKKSDGNGACRAGGCTQQGLDDFSAATTDANVSTAAFAVGLVALAAGTYLLLVHPSTSPRIASSLRRVGVEVSW